MSVINYLGECCVTLSEKTSTKDLVKTVMQQRSCSYEEAISFLLRFAQNN
ncbi:hypothetical protein LFYK43_03550 [Ligilactobacillus salitolerans]|uniref:Uncharacterized protein n=1 Tax=Ligilactobacillus salitolerans TaxID=1808352 RepID=A0A401IQU0_9LACO|nr:hypothetical protein LFYK43_03550 [Ligilactobacillus salitolerans]